MASDGVFRLGEYLDEIIESQRFQIDAYGESSLQLGYEVCHARYLERARRNEQYIIGLDRAVLCHDCTALDYGQYVALHALARNVHAAARVLTVRYLVYLVDKDYAVFLCAAHALRLYGVHVQKPLALFLHVDGERLFDAYAAALFALRKYAAEHVVEIELDVHAGHGFELRRALGDLYLDYRLVELAVAQVVRDLGAQYRFRYIGGGFFTRFYDCVYYLVFGELSGFALDDRHLLFLYEVHGGLGEVAYHRLYVASDIADLGILCRLHLDERRMHYLCEPARYLGLADARRSFHDDVLRRYLLAHRFRQHAPAVTVAESDRDCALRFVLSYNISVELRDDLLGRKIHYATSTTILELVNMQMSDAIFIAPRATCSAVMSVFSSRALPAASA